MTTSTYDFRPLDPASVPTPPAYFWVPERYDSLGPEIIDLWSMCGMSLDPEQKLAIDAQASIDRRGNWVAGETCIIEARQNGKTKRIAMPCTLADLFLWGGHPGRRDDDDAGKIMHTAQLYKTSEETFSDIQKIIDGTYELRRRVKRIIRSAGQNVIETYDGSELHVLARSRSAGRGLSGRRIDFDEAYATKSEQIGAIVPTLLAKPNTQICNYSSAAMEDSSQLYELMSRGRLHIHSDECANESGDPCALFENRGDPSLVYIEWKSPGDWDDPGCHLGKMCNHHWRTPGCALDDDGNIRAANPAVYHGRMEIDKIKLTMRRKLPPLEFGREILSWPDPQAKPDVIPITSEEFETCKNETSSIVGDVVLTFDVAPDRQTAAIGVAGYTASGARHGELAKYGRGTDWIVNELVRMKSAHKLKQVRINGKRRPAIICDPSGPAAVLLPALQEAGIEPYLMRAREMGSAAGGLQDAVKKGSSEFVHIGQAEVELAVQGAVRRDIGDGGWAFGRKKSAQVSVDICPLIVVAEAVWGLTIALAPKAEPRAAWG